MINLYKQLEPQLLLYIISDIVEENGGIKSRNLSARTKHNNIIRKNLLANTNIKSINFLHNREGNIIETIVASTNKLKVVYSITNEVITKPDPINPRYARTVHKHKISINRVY